MVLVDHIIKVQKTDFRPRAKNDCYVSRLKITNIKKQSGYVKTKSFRVM